MPCGERLKIGDPVTESPKASFNGSLDDLWRRGKHQSASILQPSDPERSVGVPGEPYRARSMFDRRDGHRAAQLSQTAAQTRAISPVTEMHFSIASESHSVVNRTPSRSATSLG